MYNSQPRPRWRGFSFALHLLKVQGFSFCLAAYQPRASVYSGFYSIHAIYTAKTSKAFTGLCMDVSVDLPYSSVQQCSRYTSRLYTACATLEGIPSSATPPPIPDTTATPDAVQLKTAAYYNKVYKGAAVRPCRGSMPDRATHRRLCKSGGAEPLAACRRFSFRAFAR